MERTRSRRRWRAGLAAAAAGLLVVAAPAATGHDKSEKDGSFPTLDGPRGLDVSPRGALVVAQSTGEYGFVKHARKGAKKFVRVGKVPSDGFPPALDMNRRGQLFVLNTLGPPGQGFASLYRWTKHRGQQKVADIAKYQAGDPDPYDLEDEPTDSNPYGVKALRNGAALVADAGGNDLLRVKRSGKIYTVARVKPRTVEVPPGIPSVPEGPPVPPAGTEMPSEAVITSVTVGHDGFYYIGELRGFPATPGTSQIWRVHPRAKGAVCDPERPRKGRCKLYADGFTSVVALDSDKHGNLYVVELSKKSWLAVELAPDDPTAAIGSVYELHRSGKRHELAAGEVVLPGDVAVSRWGKVYVTTPIFGPGTIKKVGR